MTGQRKYEQKIYEAFENCTPNVLDIVINDKTAKMTEVDYIIKQREHRNNNWTIKAACLCAVFIMVIIAVNIVNYNLVVSLIALDVNPSIEITANKSDKVLSVTALNIEAENVIGDMNLKNVDLNVAVNAIIGSMFKNGYIAEAKNSILVSVVNDDAVKAAEIKSDIVKDINITLEQNNIKATIFNQHISHHDSQSDNINEMAKKYNISIGKMMFINNIVAQDPSFKVEDLVNMPIKTIAYIAGSKEINLHDVVDYDDVVFDEEMLREINSNNSDNENLGEYEGKPCVNENYQNKGHGANGHGESCRN